MAQKLCRLLVFAAFLNFSGIHNGYTFVLQTSPMQPSQSFASLASLARDLHALFDADHLSQLILAPVRWTQLSVGRAFEGAVRHRTHPSSAASEWEVQDPIVQNLEIVSQDSRGHYIKEEKEQWIKREFSATEPLRTIEERMAEIGSDIWRHLTRAGPAPLLRRLRRSLRYSSDDDSAFESRAGLTRTSPMPFQLGRFFFAEAPR